MENGRYRNWVFTCPREENEEHPFKDIDKVKNLATCWVINPEIGSTTTGYLHWQGYIVYKNTAVWSAVKKILKREAHVEVRKGTHQQAIDYCSKIETKDPTRQTLIYGDLDWGREKTKKETKNKLSSAVSFLQSHPNRKSAIAELLSQDAVTYVLHWRGLEQLQKVLTNKPRDRNVDPTVLVFQGMAGSGKTRWVWDNFPNDVYQLSRGNGKNIWWDNYNGEQIVLIDDYYGWIPLDQLLKIIDRYPHKIEYKGGMKELQSTVFIFTSNKNWEDWYPIHFNDQLTGKRTELFQAFRRRITQIFDWKIGPLGRMIDKVDETAGCLETMKERIFSRLITSKLTTDTLDPATTMESIPASPISRSPMIVQCLSDTDSDITM